MAYKHSMLILTYCIPEMIGDRFVVVIQYI